MAGYSSSELISDDDEPNEWPSEILARSTESEPEPEPQKGKDSSSNIGGPMAMSVGSFFSRQKRQQSNSTSSDKRLRPAASGNAETPKRMNVDGYPPVTSFRTVCSENVDLGTQQANMVGSNQSKCVPTPPVTLVTSRGLVGAESECFVDPSIRRALQEITSLLNTVVKRVERVESELKKQSSRSSSASDTTPSRRKNSVPLIVRSETRKIYQTLLEDELNCFSGFDFGTGSSFNSPPNQSVVKTLITEVQLANPQFQTSQIRAAVYTYYRSLNQEDSLKRRGKHDDRNKSRRRRERLLRKLQERRATFKRCSMPEKEKEKWEKVFTADIISSEESHGDDDDVVVVKCIPWRSSKVTQFFHSLDEMGTQSKSTQAKRQRKRRILGAVASQRSKPSGVFPAWVLVE